uniref:Uncharacterized protein n=1 Tax=Angiostrongylus cantonensis TaxID=6313 RepID=A0A0K0D2H7_ANGCA
MSAHKRRILSGVDPHLLNRKRPIRFVSCSNESMFMDDTAYASTVACSEEQFVSSVIDSVEWVASSRLGLAYDVVPYHSCFLEQVFYRGLGCKCTCIVGTDRRHSF